MDFLENATNCRMGLINWARDSVGSVKQQIRDLKDKLEQMQKVPNTPDIKLCKAETKKRLEELLDSEELLWKQRAKVQWFSKGDRYTKYFHAQATRRAKINDIMGL